MLEKDLNSIIVKSFEKEGDFAYKIPDPPKMVATSSAERPFDWFSMGKVTYFAESKLVKPYKAWNFNSISDHQWKNIGLIDSLSKRFNLQSVVRGIFVLGVWVKYKETSLYFFEYDTIKKAREAGKKSFKMKELLRLKELGMNTLVIKKFFDPSAIKIIPPGFVFY